MKAKDDKIVTHPHTGHQANQHLKRIKEFKKNLRNGAVTEVGDLSEVFMAVELK